MDANLTCYEASFKQCKNAIEFILTWAINLLEKKT